MPIQSFAKKSSAKKSSAKEADRLCKRINWIVERVVAAIMAILVLDVWLGVVDRYIVHWQLPWPEGLARYLMIWAALLAVSCGVARQEHIGLRWLVEKFPAPLRRTVLLGGNLIALAVFACLAWYGIAFVEGGATRRAIIFDISLALPFAAVPVSAALVCLQLLLVTLAGQDRYAENDAGGAS